GTAKVLLAYRAFNRRDDATAQRAVAALLALQNLDGSWGGSGTETSTDDDIWPGSNEETALAVEALLAWSDDKQVRETIDQGLSWLIKQVEADRHRSPQPIGFYFAKLWYHEKLYPLTFVATALRHASEQLAQQDMTGNAKMSRTS
ncbi:MAG: squalene--hopene cyclase, partial [Planctomycetales bacterium]|nr:squalene--hopene cyclase [Planctomycetales bacterium]